MAHAHEDEDECHVSGKYTEYIQSHLEDLRAKCDHMIECINKLLKDESPLAVLKGDNIRLNKTCGLVFKDESGSYVTSTSQCSEMEREDIRVDIEDHLKTQVLEAGEWKSVKRCLTNSYGDNERTTFVDEICGLARKQTYLCKNINTHTTVETFFNEQIQHLKCHCRDLRNAEEGHSHSHMPAPALIGAGVGGLLLLIVLLLVCFLCYRHRKRQQKKKRSPNVIYLPAPNADNHPVYQDIYQDIYDDRGPRSTAPNPPTLPLRYTPHPTSGARQEDEPAYLEPVEVTSSNSFRPRLPAPRQANNPGYELPPKYTERPEYELASHPDTPSDIKDSDDGGYFQPLPSPPADKEAEEDTLADKETKAKDAGSGYETVADAQSSTSLGPVPAKRTKKDDRQTESQYFVLERLDDGDKMKSEHDA